MEKQFDLKKFLVENKLTTNSKMLKENFDNQISVIQNFYKRTTTRGIYHRCYKRTNELNRPTNSIRT
jgi:hypothetical protein